MRLLPTLNNKQKRNLLNHVLLYLATVAIIVWFLPRNTAKHFNYEINKPWIYGSFIADFDFPILKSEATIKAERDSVLKNFKPYYNLNEDAALEQIDKLRAELRSSDEHVPQAIQHQIVRTVEQLYKEGILSSNDYKTLSKDTSTVIKIVDKRNATNVQVTKLYSPKKAYEQLVSRLSATSAGNYVAQLNLNEFLEPNLKYDESRSETEKNDLVKGLSTAKGFIQAGQRIIDQGEIVDEYKSQVLASFERETQKRTDTKERITNTLMGQILFVGIMVLMFSTFLFLFRSQYYKKQRNVLLLYSQLIIFPVLVSLIIKNTFLSVYIIPFAIGVIFIRVFMDTFTAFVAHVVIVAISAIAVKYQFEFIVIQLIPGFIAIYFLRELSSRSQILVLALVITLGYCAIFSAINLIRGNGIDNLDSRLYIHLLINGMLLLLSYPLMFIYEKIFGFTSNVSLIELSNTNKGLLRKLSEVAPGTFQHSIMVGNLAAAIANKIGANSTLVRTGALYHDIGKMQNPAFFTENQKNVNPHSRLTNLESARIIINHVTEGVRLADKQGLPNVIRDFILTHHGKGLTKYFYINYKNEHPDEDVDKRPFMYPGPNPKTKEQAILMMADTVEAASRSLKDISEESITEHVNRLIDQQVAEGMFKTCPISFRDIDDAKKVLIQRLNSIYHTRIEYPKLQKPEGAN